MSKTTATQLFAAGYTDLVSVIPPKARLSATSKIDKTQLGKCPGKYYGDGLWGGYNWREFKPAAGHALAWDEQGANIGLHAAHFPAVDIDSTEPVVVRLVRDAAEMLLGDAPTRTGRAPKCLMVYRAEQPFTRMRLWLADEASGEQHLVEVLGDGQQYVVAGAHPSGATYDWDRPLHDLRPDGLALITPAMVEQLFEAIKVDAEFMGYAVSREGAGRLTGDRELIDQASLRAPSFEECEKAVAVLPNNNDLFPGRDDYLRVGYAIKASVGEAGLPLFLVWAGRWGGNDRVSGNDLEEAEADWRRMVPPYEVGWEYLATMARAHGYDDTESDFGEGVLPAPAPAVKNAPEPDFEAQAATAEAKAEDDDAPPLYSDAALARRLVNKFGGNLRYCEPLGGWQLYNHGRWGRDETLMVEYMAHKICLEQARRAAEDPTLDKSRGKEARRLGGSGAQSSTLVKARSDRRVVVQQEQFDADPWLLNTPAGVVDLRTGLLGPHDPRQYHTRMTAVAPVHGQPVEFLRFLHEATAGDQGLMRLIQIKAGYWLTGVTREHDITFIWGPGGNGKSVLVNALSHILGDYAATADTSTFAQTKNEQHPEALARLRGARLVLANETQEGVSWNESRVKQASGGDKMTARFMNQNSFEFTPRFKLVFVGNHKPRIANLDQAIKRRFHLIPFTVTPKVIDRTLDEKLKAEAGKILAWAIEGCLMWQSQGIELPAVVRNATAEYFTDEDPLGRFLEERCVLRHDATALTSGLYEAWRDWAHEQGEHVRTARWLTSALAVRPGIERWKCSKTGQRGLRGVELLYDPGEFEAQPLPAKTTA